MKISITTLLLPLLLVSCNSIPNKKVNNTGEASLIPEMKVVSAEDWGGNITMHISSEEKTSPEITRYKILSVYHNMPVGFWLVFKRPKEKKEFISNGVTFLPLGDTSNNFLKALAEIYQVKQSNPVFADSVTITYADLSNMVDTNKPGNWIAAQTKLFFTTDDDNPELFMNIENESHTISFLEKDSSYRGGIVSALSRHSR